MVKKVIDLIKRYAPWVIIGILVFILTLRECSRPDPCVGVATDTLTVHDTIQGDSVPYAVAVEKPVVVRDTIRIPSSPVDTQAILMAYFTENYYSMVLKDDTSAYCEYNTSVFNNELQPGEFVFQNRRPWHITNTYTSVIEYPESKFKMYAGISIGRSTKEFGLAPSLAFGWKNFIIGGRYDLINSDVYVDIMYKLSLKKNKKQQAKTKN